MAPPVSNEILQAPDDAWEILRKTRGGRMIHVTVTLSDWMYRSVMSKSVLTLHRDYFRLRKPLERRMYELARKHCGRKDEWRISLDLLQKKCGLMRGTLDSDTLRREGDRVMEELGARLNAWRSKFEERVTGTLTLYFDPQAGTFVDRVNRLVRDDGELASVVRRQVAEVPDLRRGSILARSEINRRNRCTSL